MAREQQIRSKSSLHRVQLIIVLILVSALCLATATHHPLHCTKWKSNCHKYDKYCRGEESVENRVWKSCCEPLSYEVSGSGSETNCNKTLPSDIYSIKTSTYSNAQAWCDMTTDGGGWTVILRRVNVSKLEYEAFNRFYDEYEDGFGDLSRNFFYGLRAMYDLTSRADYEARIDFYTNENDTESSSHGVYNNFKVGNKEDGYSLQLGKFTPSEETLLDNLKQFNGQPFLAKKRDQILLHPCIQPATSGGWWYTQDKQSCRGDHGKGTVLTDYFGQIAWFDPQTALSKRSYLKYELKIRLRNCVESDTILS